MRSRLYVEMLLVGFAGVAMFSSVSQLLWVGFVLAMWLLLAASAFRALRARGNVLLQLRANKQEIEIISRYASPYSYRYLLQISYTRSESLKNLVGISVAIGKHDYAIVVRDRELLTPYPIAVKADEVNKIFDELREYLAQHPVEGGGESGVTPTEAPTVANNQ